MVLIHSLAQIKQAYNWHAFTSQFGKRLKTWDLTKLGNIRKKLNLGGDIASAQSLFQILNFGNSNQKVRKSKYPSFLVVSAFTGLRIFSGIV